MNTKTTTQIFILLLILSALLPLTGQSQTLQNLSLAISPQSPKTEEEVKMQAVLIGADPELSSFEWFKNGKENKTASGKGKNVFIFQAGNETRTVVDVVVTTPDGNRLSATRAITREQPMIIWWTDTSAPYWYKGKALPSPGSIVTIMAIPGAGFGEPASSLMYSWNINVEPYPEISGIGKNSFTLKTSLVPDVSQQVVVRISNRSQTITQEATLVLPTRDPELFVYKLNPSGLTDFSNVVSSFGGEAGEAFDFIAEPFYFMPEQIASLKYTWRVNNQIITGEEQPNILKVKTSPGQISENTISVQAAGPGFNEQKAEYSFNASFR